MSTYTLTIVQNGNVREVSLGRDQDLLSAIRESGAGQVHAPCGGNGTCGQCRVQLDGQEVLACRTIPNRSCTVSLPTVRAMEVTTDGSVDIAPGGKGLGVAVDVGTTTVAAYLYDLASGRCLAVWGERNAQAPFGADVISRIQYASTADGLIRLSRIIRTQIANAIDDMCGRTGHASSEVRWLSIAGNTVMEHILVSISPESIGTAPFTPVTSFGFVHSTCPLFPSLDPRGRMYLCPALAGYVGGDITAGLYSSGAWQSEDLCLFLDVGTNGEMGLGDRTGFRCCATAAGPAFEGAEIECGMAASPGAISKVYYVNSLIKFDVIGDVEPAGICGSGLIDALAALLRAGAVDGSGRLLPPEEVPEEIRANLRQDGRGALRYYLSETVYISAQDIRQLQLAKAAIRAGIETLLAEGSRTCAEIGQVLIAGGFGAYMDIRSACAIGLLPPELGAKARHIGNSAGSGAALALTKQGREDLAQLAERCSYLELSSSPLFMETYIECMIFDEVEDIYGVQ
jgi:uncharacterized 2Fe-2S/4Fe-4S cluster protein (DUF4445 family)